MSLAAAIASSSVSKLTIGATGPKISSASRRLDGGDVGEDGRAVEVARTLERPAAGQNRRAALDRVGDELVHLVALGGVDQRADVGVGLDAAAEPQLLHPRRHPA